MSGQGVKLRGDRRGVGGVREGVLRIGGRGVGRHYLASLSGVSTRTSGKERAQRESIRAHGF